MTDIRNEAAVPLMTFHGSVLDDSDCVPSDEEDPLESVLSRMKHRPQASQPHDFWPSVLLSGSLCLVFGFVLSYVTFIVSQKSLSMQKTAYKEVELSIGTQIINLVSESQFQKYLLNLQGDSSDNMNQVNHHFKSQDFDNVYIFNYTATSAQPDPQHRVKVNLLEENGKVHSSYFANISTNIIGKFDLKGPVVYVNYGLTEDWMILDGKNNTLTDFIVIARTGMLWPEDIASAASQRSAKALLLFSETKDQSEFPFWFPFLLTSGSESQGFQIPVATLHIRDAEDILRIMLKDLDAGTIWDVGTSDWSRRGTLQLQAELFQHTSVISNVVAVLGGQEEPDRYVIIGAHRTTLKNETAALMELARIFGELRSSKNWRPRRTLILASWGGQGTVGTAAWVAQFQRSLAARIIGYIDIRQLESDGNDSLVAGSALLKQSVFRIASMLHQVSPLGLDTKMRQIPLPIHRSDCFPFIHIASSPCLNLRFTNISTLNTAVQMGAMISWLLIDSSLIPFDIRDLADSIADGVTQLHAEYDEMLSSHGLSLQVLEEALKEFTETVSRFQNHVDKKTIHTDLQLREINDQIRQLAAVFVLPKDSTTRDEFIWRSSTSLQGGFGYLRDLLILCSSHLSGEHTLALHEYVNRLALALSSASALLLPSMRLQ